MDEELTRARKGTRHGWNMKVLHLKSCAFPALEGADGHGLVSPSTPRCCMGGTAGLDHLVASALGLCHGGPWLLMITGPGTHEKKVLHHCTCDRWRWYVMNAVKGVFLKEKEKFEIKCERVFLCVCLFVWHSEPR